MHTLQPEQAHFLMQVYLPVLKSEHRTTHAVIEAIPEGKADYRPEAIAKSALEIVWHIVASEHRFLSGISAGEFDFNPIHRPEHVKTPVEIGKWFEESFAGNFEKLSKLSGEGAAKVIDFRGMFQMPAASYLDFTIRHSIHHRGQLSTYLRPMGGKVPAIYGESYDSAEAKKTAKA